MSDTPRDSRRDGRAWTENEVQGRYFSLPEELEMVGGKLCDFDEWTLNIERSRKFVSRSGFGIAAITDRLCSKFRLDLIPTAKVEGAFDEAMDDDAGAN